MFQDVYDETTKEKIKNEFERLKEKCYLDSAGSTLYAKSQIESVSKDLLENIYANTHSGHLIGKFSSDLIDQIRFTILNFFQTTSNEYSVIFTSGATGALKLLAESFNWSSHNDNQKERSIFCYLQDNHTSVLGMRELAARNSASIQVLSHKEAFEMFNSLPKENREEGKGEGRSNSLFAYSAQCNFSGFKYPLEWIEKVQNDGALNDISNSKWFCLLDAATFVSTNSLDLRHFKPDFISISFYKIFGYPTGLGALIVKNSSAYVLNRNYFGGGTVLISLSTERFHIPRPNLYERFEDGSLPFLSIIALRHGFELFRRLNLSMDLISRHTFSLAQYLYFNLLILHHPNGNPLVKLYSDSDYTERTFQGNIVNFNLLRSNGDYVGYVEVLNMANLHGIQLRTGCFCNPGACQRHLSLTVEDLRKHFQNGHVCGDDRDLIDGQPTGSVRVSFGYMSTHDDANHLLNMIKNCFLDGEIIFKIPNWFYSFQKQIQMKLNRNTPLRIISLEDIKISNYKKTLASKRNCNLNEKMKRTSKNVLLQITVFPIKSCGGFRPSSWPLSHKGLLYDREWMIVTESGVCLTQKQETKMCLIKPYIDLEKHILHLSFPDMKSIKISLEISDKNIQETSLCQSKVCNDRIEGIDCGDHVALWISSALKRDGLRLIRQSDSEERLTKQKNGKLKALEYSISLVNQGQFLLLNYPTILWLQDHLENFEKEDLSDRFRSNLIVSSGESFNEHNWKEIKIGDVKFQIDGPCTRCQMVCIDQKTGHKTKEPLSTLARLFKGKMKFGLYLNHYYENKVSIHVGDKLEVKELRDLKK